MKRAATVGLVVLVISALVLLNVSNTAAKRERGNRPHRELIRKDQRMHRVQRQRVRNLQPRVRRRAASSQVRAGTRHRNNRRLQWGRARGNGNRPQVRNWSRGARRNGAISRALRQNRQLQRAQRSAFRGARGNRRAFDRRNHGRTGRNFLNAFRRHGGSRIARTDRRGFTRQLRGLHRALLAYRNHAPKRFRGGHHGRHFNWVHSFSNIDLAPIYYLIEQYGYGPEVVEHYVDYGRDQGLSLAEIILGIQALIEFLQQFQDYLPAGGFPFPPPPGGPPLPIPTPYGFFPPQ